VQLWELYDPAVKERSDESLERAIKSLGGLPTGTPLRSKTNLPNRHMGKAALDYFKGNLMGADDPTSGTPWKGDFGEQVKERKFFDKSVIDQPKNIEAQMSYGEVDAWHGGGKLGRFTSEQIKDRTVNFLKPRPPEQIQNIMNSVTKSLKIPAIDPVAYKGLEDLGEYGSGLTRGRHVSFLKNENDTNTAIHELIHHVQEFTTKNADDHGNTWNQAKDKVIKLLNSKFDISISPKSLEAWGK
jgi:hypothetical protein